MTGRPLPSGYHHRIGLEHLRVEARGATSAWLDRHRPDERWPWAADGSLLISREPLDLDALLLEADQGVVAP